MKGIVITTDLELSVRDFEAPLYESIGKAVGGYIEVVHPMGLKEPYCIVVNEEGLLKNLPLNPLGSLWYGTQHHGHPIVGDIVLTKEGFVGCERDFVGFEDAELESIMEELKGLIRPYVWLKKLDEKKEEQK